MTSVVHLQWYCLIVTWIICMVQVKNVKLLPSTSSLRSPSVNTIETLNKSDDTDRRTFYADDNHNDLSNNNNNNINHGNTVQRPLYNIAHMSNSIKKTLSDLSRGANAVEVDVTFRSDDLYLYHGYPCDCFRFCWDVEPLSKYLNFARKITTPDKENFEYDPRFVILYFDTKLKNFNGAEKYRQGSRFASYLERYFFHELPVRSTLKLVVSIAYATDVDFLRALLRYFRERNIYDQIKHNIGFDVGMDTDMENIRRMWSTLNVTNVWQGEGITNCFNPIIGHTLDRLVAERDSNHLYPQKVYRWTIDLSDSIKSALHHGVDGIMTNHPERVAKILREPEFRSTFRMATVEDDPFYKQTLSQQQQPQQPSPPANVGRGQAGSSNNLDRVITLIYDLKDSIYYFVVELFQSIIK